MTMNIYEILSTDLDWWSQVKQRISSNDKNIVFKQGEIWWCSVGLNLGEEIFGKGLKFSRPVLIFRKFTRNSFMGLPLTSLPKHGSWYVESSLNGIKRWVILNQARIFDKKRLSRRIGTLDGIQFDEIKKKFVELYTI